MKIIIFGGGQLGTWYQEYLATQGADVSVARDVDIRDKQQVSAAIAATNPDVVINTAAKTNLDWCEQNKLACFDVNVLGTDVVAAACQKQGAHLVHLSSGCVQSSGTPEEAHAETDLPAPVAFYSWTKVWAEELINERISRHGLKALILRPRQLVSSVASPRNALVKMLTYSKFIDTPNSITVIEDLMQATWQLVQQNATGTFNIANPGVTSPYKMALMLQAIVKPGMEVGIISKDELNKMTFAKRIDCVLDCSKMIGAGINLRPADDRLREIMVELKANLTTAGDVMQKTEQETREKLSLVKDHS